MKKTLLILLAVANLFLINSCENKTEKNVSQTTNQQINISNAWITPAAKNRNSAAYFTITNNLDIADTLFEVSSTLSQLTELHETYKRTEDMLGMRSVDYIVIPSKDKFEFTPGGFHVMLIGLKENLRLERSDKIELKFKVTGNFTVPLVCRLSQTK